MSKQRKMTKVSPRQNMNEQPSNIVKFSNNYKRKKVELVPRSNTQETFMFELLNQNKPIIFATGPAGSGKSYMAVLAALKYLNEGLVDKIIITRPAVGADDEQHGFLPGDITQKLLPWTAPILDIIKEYYSPEEVKNMIANEVIELAPMAFLRGRTFKNAFIICDEMQNATQNGIRMILTRIGDNSKMVITGDLNQFDRKYTKDNGLKDFLQRLQAKESELIGSVTFTNSDIQRHPVIKEVLELYGEF